MIVTMRPTPGTTRFGQLINPDLEFLGAIPEKESRRASVTLKQGFSFP